MAISEIHFNLLCDLRRRGVLPENPRILEIGQATYYGDMDPQKIGSVASEFDTYTDIFLERGHDVKEYSSRELAKLCYESIWVKSEVTSIDPGGDEHALKHDLNQPLQLSSCPWCEKGLPLIGDPGEYPYHEVDGGAQCYCQKCHPDYARTFNLVHNHGTAEHVFNIANVFKVMHDHCEVGGVMLHESPFTGWVNHGFYSLQPTLFYDLARTNNYRIEMLWAMHLPSVQSWQFNSQEHLLRAMQSGELPNNLNLFVAFRKLFEAPFRFPQQGVYTPFASEEVRAAWREMR